MKYLSKENILQIHSMAIDETGGSHGVRDLPLVLSVENAPKQKAFGKELYPTVFLKAALYARDIIQSHPFLDGNKRTGMLAAFVFLEDNEYISIAKEGEIYAFALKIIKKKLSVKAIAAWFKTHSKRLKKQVPAGTGYKRKEEK